MILEKELGGYSRSIVRYFGSFQTNGSSAATVIRDGKTGLIKTVTRVSAGLYTVKFQDGIPLPARMIIERAFKSGVAVSVKSQTVEVVKGSYSQANRQFQIICNTVGDTSLSAYADPAPGDPDSGDRLGFELVGSISSAGTDAA